MSMLRKAKFISETFGEFNNRTVECTDRALPYALFSALLRLFFVSKNMSNDAGEGLSEVLEKC